MKKFEVVNLFNYFSNLKLNKFGKETRNVIVNNFSKIENIKNQIDEDVNKLKETLLSENIENVQKLALYREAYKTATEESKIEINNKIKEECQPALEIEAKLFVAMNKLYGEYVEIDIKKINKEMFIDECTEAGIDVTLSELSTISAIFE